jgi:iron complex transport system ATP-binding protein
VTDPALIDIRNATIWRGSTRVFDNLTLTIPQHQSIAILGPNGAGKTTLLKAINRELYPVLKDDSWLRILGRDRWNVWELRRQIGLVSPDLQGRYTPNTTALEVVVSGFHASIGVHGTLANRVTDQQRDAARDVLTELGMAEFASTELQAMSTGERRRCLLARALVHKPATLILDEPTSGLDISGSFGYLRQISMLARQGQNIVIVTHHLNEIPPEVQRVVLLKEGAVVADGLKDDTLTSEMLSHVYETAVRISKVDGYFLAYPG